MSEPNKSLNGVPVKETVEHKSIWRIKKIIIIIIKIKIFEEIMSKFPNLTKTINITRQAQPLKNKHTQT